MDVITQPVLQAAEVRVQPDRLILTISAPHLLRGEAQITVAPHHVIIHSGNSEAADLKILLPVEVDISRYSAKLLNGVLEVEAARAPISSSPPLAPATPVAGA